MLADRAAASTVVFNFSTAVNGAPITLLGSPVVSIYKNSTTQSTAGVTLTVDYDGVTGLNHVVVDTSADGFYAAGNDFSAVVTTGTVGGQSIAGSVVENFSLAVTDKTGYSLSSAGVQAIWDALTAALTTANSIGKRLADYITGDAYARLGAPAGASVSADVAAVNAKTTNLPSDPADASDIAGAFSTVNTTLGTIPTANQNADALLDRSAGIETGWTLRQAFRIVLSALGGKASGLATTTAVYRNVTDAKDRITATVDADGNRTAVTLDAT